LHGAGLSGNNADAGHMVGLKAMIQNAKKGTPRMRRAVDMSNNMMGPVRPIQHQQHSMNQPQRQQMQMGMPMMMPMRTF
jgi:hypothetical protein